METTTTEPTALARPQDLLDHRLTGQEALDRIVQAMKEAAFALEPDDLILISTATDFKVNDADDYTRGYEVLEELGALETRHATHYERFDKPINTLVQTVRGLKGPVTKELEACRKGLAAFVR